MTIDPDVSRLPRLRTRLACGLAGAVAALLTASCSGGPFSAYDTEHFDTRADAPTDGDLAFVLPSFLPADATDITVHVDPEVPDARMYDWVSASGSLPADCQALEEASTAAPFDPDAWPAEVRTARGWRCGPVPVNVRAAANRFYAW